MARLAFLLPGMHGGGAQRVTLALIKAMIEDGHEVDLVLQTAVGELLPLVPPAVRVVDLRAARLRGALLPLVRYFRERRPDAVQASMWPVTILAIVGCRLTRLRARLIVSDHGILSWQYGSFKRVQIWLTTRIFYPLADARVCVSRDCAADLAKVSGLPESSFEVIRNPLTPPSQESRRLNESPQWPLGTRRLLTVGNLIPVKNQQLLVRALSLLNEKKPTSLVILGEGELREEPTSLAEELAVADRVLLPGYVLDPSLYYAAADVFALSSDSEAYPLVLLEALNAGLPTVSTDSGSGARQILDGGRAGRLIPVRDVCALAEAIESAFLDHPDTGRLRSHVANLTRGTVERYRHLMTVPVDTNLEIAR